MPLSKFEIKRIEKIVSQYCENKVPPHVRDQLQTTYKIIKNEVWIYEKRPIWNNPSEWQEIPVAKAKFTLKNKTLDSLLAGQKFKMAYIRQNTTFKTT